jgi:hypothetical protein
MAEPPANKPLSDFGIAFLRASETILTVPMIMSCRLSRAVSEVWSKRAGRSDMLTPRHDQISKHDRHNSL